MAQGTGGRIFMPALGPDLDKAFADIITELRTQYLLAFYPHNVPPSKDRFHTLEVRANRPELKVSARNGYYEVAGSEPGATDARVSVAPTNTVKAPEKNRKRPQ
jgi:Ca-activated chloride channel family protein